MQFSPLCGLVLFALSCKQENTSCVRAILDSQFSNMFRSDNLYLHHRLRTTTSPWEREVVYLLLYTVSSFIANHQSAETLWAHSQSLKLSLRNWLNLLGCEVSAVQTCEDSPIMHQWPQVASQFCSPECTMQQNRTVQNSPFQILLTWVRLSVESSDGSTLPSLVLVVDSL